MCPEMKTETGFSFEYDMWSLGCTLWYLFYKRTPFMGPKIQDTMRNIAGGYYNHPERPPISDYAKDLFKKIFVLNPDDRITFDQFFAHPFFTRTEIPP